MMLCALLLSFAPAVRDAPVQEPPGAREVRFSVTAPDERGPLYFAGAFNRWQPDDPAWKLAREDANESSRWTLTVAVETLTVAPIEFKLTRGSWDTVELSANLTDRPNRVLLARDLVEEIALTVEAWADDRPDARERASGPPAVTGHLEIFDLASEHLGNTRKVRAWLPPGYDAEENAKRQYPVLYMHDGQNVFDATTSFMGAEWGADETATRLIEAGEIAPLIIVGIDHAGADRTSEYNPPFTSARGVPHRGDRYLGFVTEGVMPAIERRYRVARGPRHTALGGSSFGGNITLYAALRHPDRFGAILVESPVAWVFNAELMERCAKHEAWPRRVWVAIGTKESEDPRKQAGYEHAMEVLRAAFQEQGLLPDRARIFTANDATHHESAWARRLPDALKFLFAEED